MPYRGFFRRYFQCSTYIDGTSGKTIHQTDQCRLRIELAAARAELALHEDNARQSLEEIEALRANFTEWSCRARAFEDERDQARAELAKTREILLNVGLSPNHHPDAVKAAEGASSIISELRRTLSDPPPDVQEHVLTKLGIYEQLSELAALRAEQAKPQWLPIESAPRDLREGEA